MFRAKRGLASRGDDGNLCDLLTYCADTGDLILATHLKESKGSDKYASPPIQNEILQTAADAVVDQIIDEANSSGYVSILCDESADISGKEHISVVLRYLNRDGEISENFIGIIELHDVDAESIAQAILNYLRKIGLDTQKIVGQGYDGASATCENIKGVQKIIRNVLPKALYDTLRLPLPDSSHQ
jgi:Domain of unknown function (DUF4371)